MSNTPPVPADNQSPYPIAEPPHTPPAATTTADASTGPAIAGIDQGIASAREQLGPLADKAKQFAKDRPWAAAALLGTIAAAVLGSLRRGKL